MAQLDRFLTLLVSNKGSALVLAEGRIATIMINDSARPVMKQPLTGAQILTLVREIAPPDKPHALDAAGGVRFEYICADGTFDVSLTQTAKIVARIEPKAVSANGAKLAEAPVKAAVPHAAPVRAAVPNAAPVKATAPRAATVPPAAVPQAAARQAAAPRVDVPQAPVPQAPVQQTPVLQAPALPTPVLQAPALQTPVLQAPALQTPTLQAPALQTPTLQAPALQTPTLQAPAHQARVPHAPFPQAAAAGDAANPGTPMTQARRVAATGDPAFDKIESLLRILVGNKASDLHLRSGVPPLLRWNGEIAPIPDEPALSSDDIDAMLATLMLEQNRAEFKELNDTDFAHEIPGVARFRGNALRERKGTGAVFRAVPVSVVTVEQMGISPEVQRLCHLTKGLVLVTGPTGSGKSTTLCALIDLINRSRSDHIITIEDPIEFVHESKKCLITQRHVGVHTSSFKHALRAALREDPDIVLVGELRDLETVSMAIETAETGHLVFGTVHTSTAVSTVDRIIDQFPPDRQAQIRVMLSESLKGVISQVLCKKIGGGRVAAREILLSTPSVSNLIREGKTFQLPSVLQTSRRLGMVTMNDALIDLVDSKQVEPHEAYLKATDKVGILQILKHRGEDTSFAIDDVKAVPEKVVPAKPVARPAPTK